MERKQDYNTARCIHIGAPQSQTEKTAPNIHIGESFWCCRDGEMTIYKLVCGRERSSK